MSKGRNPEWRPRVVIDLDEDLYYRVQELFPYGIRKPVFQEIIKQVVEVVEQQGQVVNYLIMAGKLRLFELPKGECKEVLGG